MAMEAGPRNRPRHHGPDTPGTGRSAQPGATAEGASEDAGPYADGVPDGPDDDSPGLPDGLHGPESLDPETLVGALPDERSFRELRPRLRMRVWQLIPIVALGALGSLMFAFPLAFEFGDGGPVVAMLGLLLSCCSAGWAIMAARRAGYTWPGLPARGTGGRPDWRFVAAYTAFAALVALLAVWRVARLR